MSLTELIRFRYLDSQIPDNEFHNHFTTSTANLISIAYTDSNQETKTEQRDDIVNSLFFYFKNNHHAIKQVIEIQSNIIESTMNTRKQISNCKCINQLPADIIGKCASFLYYKQYFRFAQCNRRMYVSCYSPSQIYALNLSVSSFQHFPKSNNLFAFKNIKWLQIHVNIFNNLSYSNQTILSDNHLLHTLTLSNAKITHCDGFEYVGHGNEPDVICFLVNESYKLIKSDNITDLTLSHFPLFAMNDILCRFIQLQCLTLSYIKLEPNQSVQYNSDDIFTWFPNLKSLTLSNVAAEFAGTIVVAFHKQLESVWIDGMNILLPPNLAFPKLEFLNLRYAKNVDGFNNVSSLKTVEFCTMRDNIFRFIDNTIEKQLSLERFDMYIMDPKVERILDKLESALYKNSKRNSCKFHMEISFDGECIIQQIGIQIFRLVNSVKALQMEDWYLKIQIIDGYGQQDDFVGCSQQLFNELEDVMGNISCKRSVNEHDENVFEIVFSKTKIF